jgi:hypothetical protein
MPPAREYAMSDQSQNFDGAISAIARFAEFFNQRGWGYNQNPTKPVIHTGFSGDNGRWQCVAVAGPEDKHLLFLSLLPSKATSNRRAACAELLTRINFGLALGCFEMDFEDGEIRFRTSIPLVSEDVSPEMVEHLVFSNLSTVDRFFGAIMSVIHADVSPKAALNPAAARIRSTARFELN